MVGPRRPHTKATRASTSQPYYLFDEAVARVTDATQYGTLKGVLRHQGEYNSDKIHFDAYSQRLLGQRYANAMTGFYSEPFRS